MLKHELLLPEGILILEPAAPLEADDFATVAREIDPYIAEQGTLSGLLIHATSFPGWVDLQAFLAHMRFVESHHEKIEKLALVSDSPLLMEIPRIIGHLVHPQVKHFPEAAYKDALQWLRE